MISEYEPSQLPDIDVVELVDLKSLQANRVNGYMKIAKDAPHVHIQGETAQQIAHLWRQLPFGEQMRCHIPLFGLRFYVGSMLLVQGSVCWECNNIFVEENGEDLAYTFDAEHTHSQQLLGLLKQIVDRSSEAMKQALPQEQFNAVVDMENY